MRVDVEALVTGALSAIGSKWCAKLMAFFEDRVDCRGAAEWLGLLVVKCDDATESALQNRYTPHEHSLSGVNLAVLNA